MPLRVAEKDGYIYAVNGCGDCHPFNGWDGHMITFCSHRDAKEVDDGLLYRDRIPIWCPLPRDESDGKIVTSGDKIEINSERVSRLDMEGRG